LVWFKFVLCLAIILFAGTKLARYGDAIAEKTGLGRVWIGLVLLATITSMPELVTGVSSVALVKPPEPDLALGTLLGSCSLNLVIVALLDVLHRRSPVLSAASSRHRASAGWGILLIVIAGGAILAGGRFSGLALGWVAIPSIIILMLYLVGMWWLFRRERSQQLVLAESTASADKETGVKKVYFRFALAGFLVIGAGIWLSFIGNEIAVTTGWDATFVGSLFLAITTSMPELVVSVAALRVGAIDMAVANILGSNMLNLALIAPVDLFYTEGSILSSVSKGNLISVAVVVAMSLIVIAGLKFRQKRKILVVSSWYSPALVGLYILGAYALFTSGVGL
jgi:cation:H+ antiporter